MKNFIAKMGAILLALGTVMALSGCGEDSGTNPYADAKMVDSRDGKTYKTVKIGDKVWMAENLNYDYNHGTAKSFCYENEPENCDKYGRLYTWAAAIDSAAIFSKDGARCGYGKKCEAIGTVRGVCPEGWHLPSKEELEDLKTLAGQKAGDIDMAGTVLKSTTGWNDYKGNSGNGTDGLGFGALPAGYYYSDNDRFDGEGNDAFFWSSTERNSDSAYYLGLGYDFENARVGYYSKSSAFSVRCVKNSN